MEENLYTLIIYTENTAGLLSQVSAVFTRRQVNIESINACASSTPGVHKYTITCCCTEEMVVMLTKQLEKKVDVLQANYFRENEVYILEAALYKLSSPVVLDNKDISRVVRLHDARIVEVNPTYTIVEKWGMTDEIMSLYEGLKKQNCILQFVRSGRIAITKGNVEHLDEYLAERNIKYERQKALKQ